MKPEDIWQLDVRHRNLVLDMTEALERKDRYSELAAMDYWQLLVEVMSLLDTGELVFTGDHT